MTSVQRAAGRLVYLLLLLAAACWAAPRAVQGPDPDQAHSRVRRNNQPSNYWWIPGSPGLPASVGRVGCGDPNIPLFGRSFYESVQAGAIVVHSCNPGYRLVGAKLRLCQSNGQWTPELPHCSFVDCGHPGVPAHGSKWVGSTSLGSIAKFKCDSGYQLVGVSYRVCQSSGLWSGVLPLCQSLGCPRLAPPLYGRVSVSSNRVGAVATYSCDNGFVLVGQATRTCGQGSVWLGKVPICREIDCGELVAPENGRVTFKGTLFGAVAFYECDAGFRLVGEEIRTCQSSGQWSGREPSCRALECDPLGDVENGRVIVQGRSVGSVARYVCNSGFSLEGQESRTCLPSGDWSGVEPTCRPVDCGQLAAPANGEVSFASTVFGSVATYLCDTGFELVGAASRTCESSGSWSDEAPVCQPSGCDELPFPTNGVVFLTGTSAGSLATYVCNNGFRLSGPRNRVCLISGSWSGEEPTCNRLDCGKLANPENGHVTVTDTSVGSTATYSCASGFQLLGMATRICQSSGVWSGAEPICRAINCPYLPFPSNGGVFLTSTSVGSTATYHCNRGFVLEGSETRSCLPSGEWSGKEPICRSAGCGSLDNPTDGQVLLSGGQVGSTATYSCDEGFILVGIKIRTCQLDGTWSGEAPICRVVDCGNLESPGDGAVSLTGTTFGSSATYTCQPGFQLVGVNVRTCLSSGTWSGQEPFCQPIECDRLEAPEDGRVVLSGIATGSVATYFCAPGFLLQGPRTRTCQSNGEWSEHSPTCIAVVCPDLPSISNGHVSLSGNTVGSLATYTCGRGFGLVGVSSRRCQIDGNWSGSEPLCKPNLCPELLPPSNAIVETTGVSYGDSAIYSCLPGYILVGEARRNCQVNGIWSGEEPFCQAVKCEYLIPPHNGEVNQSGTLLGSTATYSCLPGFELVGSETRTCGDGGIWSGSQPLCRPVDCGELQDISNGHVIFASTLFGAISNYSCLPGYALVGNFHRLCQANGQWSGEEPNCAGVLCDVLDSPQNGEVVVTGITVGSTASYSCSFGFALVGDEIRTCEDSRRWSGSAPFCRGVTCGILVAPDNGRVVVTGTQVGDRATYSCLPGFQLQGVDERVCQENGEWAYSEPTCIAIECPDLSDPENGTVTVASNIFGSLAVYRCSEGFGLVGKSIRQCQADGSWSEQEPTCEISNCDDLQSPNNGSIKLTGTSFGDTATYSCDMGFMLLGESTRTCEAGSFWSGVVPFCSPVECSILEPPQDGQIMFISTSFGAMARYRCFLGHELIGVAERLCQVNGEWSGSEPLCRKIECNLLLPPKNGDISYSQGLGFGSAATYVCEPPFQLVGNTIRVCMENGTWSGLEPICEGATCPSLENPQNGAVEVSGSLVGSTALYSCDDGFNLIGSKSRVCQTNGFWTGVTPLCQPTDCDTLKPPENGDVILTGTTIGSRATYSCEKGYSLSEGNEVRVCGDGGQWNGEEPICRGVSCGTLVDPTDGNVNVKGLEFGSTATYTCNSGFVLFGKGIRTCLESGVWNGQAPECRVVDCDHLSSPENGEVSYLGTSFGFTASYSCNIGHRLVGANSRVCLLSGKWSGNAPTCQPAVCADLPDPANGNIKLTGTEFGDTASYSCDVGFQLVGPAERICLANGRWSGSLPVCNARNCGSPPFINNGRFALSSGTDVGSVATYRCNIGYQLSGIGTRTCQADGTWSDTTLSCNIIDCGSLTAPDNGMVILSGTVFGSEALYSCNPGFTSTDIEIRVCQITGVWSGRPLVCTEEEEFDCGSLSGPANGTVELTGTSPNSVATYSCNNGFIFEGGNRERRCIDGQGWSGSAPSCVAMECSQLSAPLNGRLIVMGTTVGSISVYQCDVGYIINGAMIRTCLLGGLWSGVEPFCSAIQCGRLPDPTNGHVSSTGTQLGAVATYTCIEGYAVEGEAVRTCQLDGSWSGNTPTCIRTTPVDCGDPGVPENGVRSGDDFRIGATVSYECNTNFLLVGTDSRTCQPDGTWTGFLPVCLQTTVTECTSEGVLVFDSCMRQCTCRNGKFTDCCRLRPDFASMTINERRRYIGTVLRVATDPEYRPRYESLIAKYKMSYNTLAQSSNSSISQFLPWHRYFLLEYENLLQEIDCRVTIPFWDWTALPMNPYMAPVWNPDSGFGDSSRSNDSCVSNGPFKYDQYEVTPSAGGGCLQRQYRLQQFPTRAVVEQDLLALPANEFVEFHQFLQLFLHTNVRCFVGGQMCSADAANDPAYLLHLANIDFIFSRWQDVSQANLEAAFVTDERRLELTDGNFLVLQFANNHNLPNSIRVCYGHNEFKNHVPPGMAFLASALQDITDNPKLHMECVSQEDRHEVAMSSNDEDFMRKMCNQGGAGSK